MARMPTGIPQHIPASGFPAGAHNPQPAAPPLLPQSPPQKHHLVMSSLLSSLIRDRGTAVSPSRPVGIHPDALQLNFMQPHERHFHKTPLISVCYSQNSFPSSASYFKRLIFKGSRAIACVSPRSQAGGSAREEELSILGDSALGLSLGLQILPPCTYWCSAANKHRARLQEKHRACP